MNTSKGKTESMLFDTKKRLGMITKSLNLVYNGAQISSTTRLGVSLDQSLTLSNHFNKVYRSASNKLYFIDLLKASLTRGAMIRLYTGIILSGMLFSCPLLDTVKKRVLSDTCNLFSNYFKVNNNRKNMRNGGFMIVLPHTKLKFGKSGFYVSRALSLKIRKCNSFISFKYFKF